MERKFQSIEEIMTYINAEAERRLQKILREKGYDTPMGIDEIENAILGILRKRPASSSTICSITGKPTNYIIHRLRRMQKYGLVRVATKKNTKIWSLPQNKRIK